MEKIPALRIALVQTNLHWQEKTSNLAQLEEKIWNLKGTCDLIVLPEMFPTGFSMDSASLAEPMNLQVHKWMKQLASQIGAVITGSVIISEGGKYFNRLLWVNPDGTTASYDKRHLFRMASENTSFTDGTQLPIFELKGWKICPQICYDLRFPVWSRNRWTEGKASYDLLMYVASWPAARISAWDILLPARAIENLSYCLGVNRIGLDGNQIAYNGHSAAFDFKGEKVADLEELEQIQLIQLDHTALADYRSKFPAWQDADTFTLHVQN